MGMLIFVGKDGNLKLARMSNLHVKIEGNIGVMCLSCWFALFSPDIVVISLAEIKVEASFQNYVSGFFLHISLLSS